VLCHAEVCTEELASDARLRAALPAACALSPLWGGTTLYAHGDLPFNPATAHFDLLQRIPTDGAHAAELFDFAFGYYFGYSHMLLLAHKGRTYRWGLLWPADPLPPLRCFALALAIGAAFR
jgi:hypothetical protein